MMFIAPSEFAAIEVDLFEMEVIYGGLEGSHETSVEVGVALVGCLVDEIEIAHDDPFFFNCGCNVPQFLHEVNLVIIFLWAVDPP